ncbi:MAG TPA: four helix bundle protein [Candidatus Saccharimonadales bacterium]|nr:four helix bundle protein [Candidatus Saccharimonadales bacterium]
MSNYEKLKVWQVAHQLTVEIYMLTKKLPKEELFGLTSQIRRAAVSVESNLAEGESRYSRADKIKFFIESRASGAEVETQLLLIRDVYADLFGASDSLRQKYVVLGKQINSLINFRRKN